MSIIVNRITETMLRNLYKATKEKYGEPSATGRARHLAHAVLIGLLGVDWFAKYLLDSADPNYLTQNFTDGGLQGHLGPIRTIYLAEMLYNMQKVDGFDAVLGQLRVGNLEATYAELESASLLRRSKNRFRFVAPQGMKGHDYDLEIHTKSGVWMPAETKCKLESTEVSQATVFNTLEGARRRNLPEGRGSVIFLRCPGAWFHKGASGQFFCEEPALEGIKRFLRGTSRIGSVFSYAIITHPLDDDYFVSDVVVSIINNDICLYEYARCWNPHINMATHSWFYFLKLAGGEALP